MFDQVRVFPIRPGIIMSALLVVVALSAALCGPACAQSELRGVSTSIVKDMVTDPDVAKLKGEKLLVAEFENINGKGDAVPRIFQEMLTTAFIKDKHFKVIERAQLEKALKELSISYSGLVDPDNAKKIGKMVGAAYMVVGSISDLGGKVSIDARIVSIESGESVTAADAAIDTQGSPASASPSTSQNAPSPASKLDLSQQGNSSSAGQAVGKMDNLGLLGGTKFKVAWRESLGSNAALAFAVGDVTGDGSARLALFRITEAKIGLQDLSRLEVTRWTDGHFEGLWHSEYAAQSVVCTLNIPPTKGAPAPILLGGYRTTTWLWNGTTYQTHYCSDGHRRRVYGWIPGATLRMVGIEDYSNEPFLADFEFDSNRPAAWAESPDKFSGCGNAKRESGCTGGDLDGDGLIEIAEVEPSLDDGKPIEVFALDGSRKAVTDKGYGTLLATWIPGNVKTPYLIARKNSFDDDKKPNGGYVHFIQWSGESYEEVWKSNKIDDAIIDMKVCDPKGEGKDGLVILSSDKKNSYLTKIVAE